MASFDTTKYQTNESLNIEVTGEHMESVGYYAPGGVKRIFDSKGQDLMKDMQNVYKTYYSSVNSPKPAIVAGLVIASNEEFDRHRLINVALESIHDKYRDSMVYVIVFLNNLPIQSSAGSPKADASFMVDAFLRNNFLSNNCYAFSALNMILSVSVLFSENINTDVDEDISTVTPGIISNHRYYNKQGVQLRGDKLVEKVMANSRSSLSRLFVSIAGYVEQPPVLKQETDDKGYSYNVMVPQSKNVEVITKDDVVFSQRRNNMITDSDYNGMFLIYERLKDRNGDVYGIQNGEFSADSAIKRAFDEVVNKFQPREHNKIRIGIVTSSSKKKIEFNKGLIASLNLLNYLGVKDDNFEYEVCTLKPDKMPEIQSKNPEEVVKSKFMDSRFTPESISLLIGMDILLIEDTIFTIKELKEPGTFYQPHSEEFAKVVKNTNILQNSVNHNYDRSYDTKHYNFYNSLLCAELNGVIDSGKGKERTSFAQTLIICCFKNPYGTCNIATVRGVGNFVTPASPSGTNGFGWDTIAAFHETFSIQSSIKGITIDYNNYRDALFAMKWGQKGKSKSPRDIAEEKRSYEIIGKTIADLPADVVFMLKPRMLALAATIATYDNLRRCGQVNTYKFVALTDQANKDAMKAGDLKVEKVKNMINKGGISLNTSGGVIINNEDLDDILLV